MYRVLLILLIVKVIESLKAPDHQANLPSNIVLAIDVPSFGLLAE